MIAENCEMVGDLHFKDQLLINGCVKGNIYAEPGSKAQVTVSEKGTFVEISMCQTLSSMARSSVIFARTNMLNSRPMRKSKVMSI